MKLSTPSIVLALSMLNTEYANGFAFVERQITRSSLKPLQMGLLDDVKDAFAAPALERSTLDSERETPIDRWMGWNAKPNKTEETAAPAGSKAPSNFVDSMDAANYVTVEIEKPMGIVFEENDNDVGGIFLLSLKEGGNADKSGVLKPGDQLVAVGAQRVHGKSFDDALGAIVDSEENPVKMAFFRGSADMFYGPTGASKDWLDEFLSSQ